MNAYADPWDRTDDSTGRQRGGYRHTHRVCGKWDHEQLMWWLIVSVALGLMGLIMPEPISIAMVFFALGVLIRSVAIDRKQE
jgi:hypothetical protein